MPTKAKRSFTVDAATGEVRCQDPSCAITQCGQCNIEQNARKRAERKKKNEEAARALKASDDLAATTQARANLAAGKVFTWTYDQEENEEGDNAMQSLAGTSEQKAVEAERQEL
jgi:hypothetical protein